MATHPLQHAKRNRRVATLTVGLLTIVGLTGCASATSTTPTAPGGQSSTADVPWEDYAPEVKQRIDSLVAQQKCNKLQKEFDVADRMNEATFNRTGHNNAELMGYIDDGMRSAGCYPDDPLAP